MVSKIIILALVATVLAKDATKAVKISQGELLGNTMISRGNREFTAFRGIPYAQPPVGDLRFKAPVPANAWEGVFDATKNGNICKQKNTLFSQNPPIEGSEDCLYLNVYTPNKLETPNCTLMPVMVFIHYGGFFVGSSHSDLIGPQYFMDKDVILVTFNYRLGVFGFYSTLDDEAPGNFGLKDQVLALKWVQQNIQSFGGDPDKVTIFGQSAGGGSVHHHILSKSSQGLFHQAISESGTALNLWGRPFNAVQQTIFRGIANIVGCDGAADTKTIVECLRAVDVDVLLESSDVFKYFSIEPLTVYTLVTEIKSERNPEPFLTEDPAEIIASGNFAKVPWIIGVNKDEGILRSSPLIRQANTLKQLNENFNAYGPQMFLLSASVAENDTATLWKKMTDYYLGADHIDAKDPKSVQGFTNIYTDRSFMYGAYQSALYHSFKGHRPIWFYHFNYRGALSYGDVFAATKEDIDFDWGVSHCDELLYLFPSPQILPELPEEDLIMSKTLIKLWTNFAIYGEPTPDKSPKQCDLGWEPLRDLEGVKPMQNQYLQYLNISKSQGDYPVELEMWNQFYTDRMNFCKNLQVNENIPELDL